jgi:hypothetical protein
MAQMTIYINKTGLIYYDPNPLPYERNYFDLRTCILDAHRILMELNPRIFNSNESCNIKSYLKDYKSLEEKIISADLNDLYELSKKITKHGIFEYCDDQTQCLITISTFIPDPEQGTTEQLIAHLKERYINEKTGQ